MSSPAVFDGQTSNKYKNNTINNEKESFIRKIAYGGVKPLRVVAILLFLCAAFGTSVAQTGSAQLDVSRLVGADPADIINTGNANRFNSLTDATTRPMTFMLLNVATEKFLNIGGAYGRHASLNDYGMYLWIFDNSKTGGTYNIRTRQNLVKGNSSVPENKNNADSYVQYIDNDPRKNGVYLDCQPEDKSREFGWKFEQAEGYSATNKIYRLSTYGNRYLTATPDDADGNLCEATAGNSDSDYQLWKLVTVEEYYNLFDNSPSSVSSPIDISFLGHGLHFGYNCTDDTGWLPAGPASTSHFLVSGVDGYYKKFTDAAYNGKNYNDDYLYKNSKFFCGSITNDKNDIQQYIIVSKPGWYIFRCKGFSNTGVAKLYVTNVMNSDNSETLLNPLEANGPKNMLEAGEAFYADKYENEVMIYVSSANISSEYGAYLIFGIKVDGDGSNTTTAWTAFDDFRILYAGDAPEAPQLVLDENYPDMRYLTETYYDYKNTVLHLNRSFSLNKWNTLILPVSLTYGQMKNAFGSEVLLAELYELNENSVRFKTVDCNSDADIMLNAYTPYIIKPTKSAGTNAAYTTLRLRKYANQYWLGESESIKYDGEGKDYYTGGQVTIAANHYIIPEVTLDRSLFGTKLDEHWVSKTVPNASTSGMGMACKGTLARTYYVNGNKGVFYTDGGETRDNLAGDYFMKGGEMWKVPEEKQYGLKAFRCWFELTNGTDPALNSPAPAKDVLLYIDGIADNTTAIEDVEADPIFSNAKAAYADGVYNLYGQRVRNGSSLEGLPEGIYIVNGKKVKK